MADKLKDIDHTPPYGGGANTVWERGNEHEPEEPTSTDSPTDADVAASAADD